MIARFSEILLANVRLGQKGLEVLPILNEDPPMFMTGILALCSLSITCFGGTPTALYKHTRYGIAHVQLKHNRAAKRTSMEIVLS